MKKTRKRRLRASHEALVESARSNAASAPRKHHLVPASYLRRWEYEGRLWVADRRTGKTYQTAADKAARETDFYRVEDDNIDPEQLPPLYFETALSRFEGAAASAFDRILADGRGIVDNDDARFHATNFVSVQIGRGHRFREGLRQMVSGFHRKTMQTPTAEQIRHRHGEHLTDEDVAGFLDTYEQFQSGDLIVAPAKAHEVAYGLMAVPELGPFVFSRTWMLYETAGELVTTDEPVVCLGGLRMARGVSPGVGTAGVIMLPVDPHHLLAMFAPDLALDDSAFDPILSEAETAEVNLELVAHANRLVVSSGRRVARPTLPPTPPAVPATVVEDEVPLTNAESSKVIHSFSASPWLYAPAQPLPVSRWWLYDNRRPPGSQADSPWVPKDGVALTDEALRRRSRRGG